MYMLIKKTARPSGDCSPYATDPNNLTYTFTECKNKNTNKGSFSLHIWEKCKWDYLGLISNLFEDKSEAWDQVDILFICQVFENDKGIHYQPSYLPSFKLID